MLKLYPMPVNIAEKEGTYEFNYVAVKGIENEIILGEYKDRGIVLSEDKVANVIYTKKDGLSEQEYELIINENGAEILYSYENGAFYGTQTLCQLINMEKVNHLEIKDKPLLKNRCLSFDISRGKIPTMEHFLDVIKKLSMARYNTLILYYDKIIIQFPKLEDLWEKDAITIEELWQIKKWCNERFIKLSISVETFGHLYHFLKHDRFCHLSNSLDEANPGGDLNPLDPRSIEFVDMLISDVIPFVDTDFLQVHGDEVVSLGKGKSKDEVLKKGLNTVYMEHMQKVCDLVINKYKKIPVVANDMFMKRTMTSEQILENLKKFPKGAATTDWGYESEYEYHKFSEYGKLLQQSEIPYFTCVSTGTFSQYVPRTYNQSLNAEVGCRAAVEYGGDGVVQTTWGDDGNSQFMVMEYTGIFTCGATAWNVYGFQLSYVHEYLDKYVFKTASGRLAKVIAGFGDAAWYTKGKCPDSNQFVFASNCSYDNTLLWNGYHAHTGIKQIHIYDMVDIYGCEKALEHVAASREKLNKIKLECNDNALMTEKLSLNLRMFELAIRLSYFKLCILVLKDFDRAKELISDIRFCFSEISGNFSRLWLTENREGGGEIFPGGLARKQAAFEKYVSENLI